MQNLNMFFILVALYTGSHVSFLNSDWKCAMFSSLICLILCFWRIFLKMKLESNMRICASWSDCLFFMRQKEMQFVLPYPGTCYWVVLSCVIELCHHLIFKYSVRELFYSFFFNCMHSFSFQVWFYYCFLSDNLHLCLHGV